MAEIDGALYRQVLGHFATGVTVITAVDSGEPVGMAANSFTSVSLDPPLVLFCAGTSSTTWPRIDAAGAYAVNILAGDQEEVSRKFAAKDGDRFEGVGWSTAVTGSPILDGALAYLDCTIDARHDAGDHVLVVGRVVDLAVPREGPPLLFFRGGYADLAP
ncbi:MAG TPA: flavin reductase family protein [Acidimicrobiia bacterium]|nr:flavin reductase family protein [Acidimicrobiia bacterium]